MNLAITFHTQDQNDAPLGLCLLDAKSPNGDWQQMTNPCGDRLTWLQPGDYTLTISRQGYVTRVIPMHFDEQPDKPVLIGLQSAVPVWPPNLRDWFGAFIIPDLFTGIPGGDGKRLWTPAYGIYTDAGLRREMREEFKKRGYRHFPYDLAGWIYHQEYGYLPDDPARARRDLTELLTDGIIPVVAACDDADGGSTLPFASFGANRDLIPVYFPMWEMNGPLGVATYNGDGTFSGRIVDCIKNTIAAAHPLALPLLHFTAGHGSIGVPERQGWVYVKSLGIQGLMSQDEGYQRDPNTGDPEGTAAGLQDTAARLATLGLINVAFEQCTYAVYNKASQPKWAGWDEEKQRSYGRQIRNLAPNIAGYGDGSY